jgi:hypothetical protein
MSFLKPRETLTTNTRSELVAPNGAGKPQGCLIEITAEGNFGGGTVTIQRRKTLTGAWVDGTEGEFTEAFTAQCVLGSEGSIGVNLTGSTSPNVIITYDMIKDYNSL